MRTIVIIGAIILAGAATVVVVQSNKPEAAPAFQQGPAVPISETGELLLNPEHGVSGHRCDLPVGAPLKASAEGMPVALPQPSNQAAPAGLKNNPAHGLPGHRCDLPVGAPLS